MIDFHTHLLPGIDDGALSVDDSIAMAKALQDFGYKIAVCTPHCIKGFYEHSPQHIREATLMLQADLDNAEIKLELQPGMEYMLDEHFPEFTDNLLPLGETRLVLCEAPMQADPHAVIKGLELILDKGFVPLVAHPERTQFFYEILIQRGTGRESREDTQTVDPVRQTGLDFEDVDAPNDVGRPSRGFLKRLFAPRAKRHTPQKNTSLIAHRSALPEGVLYHANLGSFTGFYGEDVLNNAYELLKRGAFTALTSDLHDSQSAAKVLHRDKLDTNPLLKKLAAFTGDVELPENRSSAGREQGELF